MRRFPTKISLTLDLLLPEGGVGDRADDHALQLFFKGAVQVEPAADAP